MKWPPAKGPRPRKNRGPSKTFNQRDDTGSHRNFQASLAHRVGDVVPISALIPRVLRITLAQGTRRHHREAA